MNIQITLFKHRTLIIKLVLLFILALGLRFAYQTAIIEANGSFDNGGDSGKYLWRAKSILKHGSMIWETADGKLFPDTQRMPAYPYFIAIIYHSFGVDNHLAISTIQIILDVITVFAIALMAAAAHRRWFFPVALLACFSSSLIFHSNIILTETLFMSFFCWGLCALVWSLRSSHRILLLSIAGILFAFALNTRPVLQFLPYLLVPVLIYCFRAINQTNWPKSLYLAAIPSIIMGISILPIVLSNYAHYGKPVLSTQSGNHAVQVVFSILDESRAEDRLKIQQEIIDLINQAKRDLSEDIEIRHPVIFDEIYRNIALEYLQKLSIWQIIYSVAKSSIRSIVQTGLYGMGYQLNCKYKYFSSIQGESLWQRLVIFLNIIFSYPFMLIWAIAQTLLFLCIPIQLLGAIIALRDKKLRPQIILLLATAGYFLMVNGPIGDPKYGLPLLPVLLILIVAGLQNLYSRYQYLSVFRRIQT